ncbi:MAG: VOC family protein [bacterium]|nr:VOC family protein [bacterium]
MRLRQVVIAARDLDATVADLEAVLGLKVAYRDPLVATFGLVNAVLPVGDAFLEVVSPTTAGAPARRFLDRRGSDGGYMVILQSRDLDADRRRVAALGVRVVWQGDLPTIRGTHLHPSDVGGAILSLDDATPPASWHWAGPSWEEHVRTDVVHDVVGVELEAPDPAALAACWSQILGRPVASDHTIALAGATLAFVPGPTTGVRGYALAATDAPAARARARARGLTADGDTIVVGGTRLRLLDAQPGATR